MDKNTKIILAAIAGVLVVCACCSACCVISSFLGESEYYTDYDSDWDY